MPICAIPGSAQTYALIAHDANGREEIEAGGDMLTSTLLALLQTGGVTDVFLACHGWNGNTASAIAHYDAWTAAMMACEADAARMRQLDAVFRPMVVVIHWPSQPWGDEKAPDSHSDLSPARPDAAGTHDTAWARQISQSAPAQAALARVLAEISGRTGAPVVNPALDEAYRVLFRESRLAADGDGGAPWTTPGSFDPQVIVDDYIWSASAVRAPTRLPGPGDAVRDALLSPLRQLSFWKMKDRARFIGEGAAHRFVRAVQEIVPDVRIHLMGHGFGCITVSAALVGKGAREPLASPVESLFLVQGALSSWAYSRDNPYRLAPGYFSSIREEGLVAGPIVTTRSVHDLAVGRFYPLGAGLAGQGRPDGPAVRTLSRYGGLGTFGMQGFADAIDATMRPGDVAYDFAPGSLFNLDASEVMRDGSGASGAHTDIVHAEVAHAFWAAAVARLAKGRGRSTLLGGRRPSSGNRAPGAGGGGTLLGSPRVRFNDLTPPGGATSDAATHFPMPDSVGNAPTRAGVPGVESVRWLRARLEKDNDGAARLVSNRWAILDFDIALEASDEAAAQMAIAEESLFARNEHEVILTIQLDSQDFDLLEATGTLRVVRAGQNGDKARFALRPLHPGPSRINAIVHKQGNFLQRMEIVFNVDSTTDEAVFAVGRGRPVAAAAQLRPRTLGLLLSPLAGGYDCTVWGTVCGRARLLVTPDRLAASVEGIRSALEQVIAHRDAQGRLVFQQGLAISEAANSFALEKLAKAGAALFLLLFFGPGSGRDAQHVGQFLRRVLMADGPPLTLQVIGEAVSIPWGLLYLAPAGPGAVLSWDGFLGMRHIVEHIPLQNELVVHGSEIPSDDPCLVVSAFMSESIDAQMRDAFVGRQRRFWDDLARQRPINFRFGSGQQELFGALTGSAVKAQIIYLFCHASASGLGDPGGPDSAALSVDSDAALTLGDLRLQAADRACLAGQPLVFINACESAQMSPAFYDGFVPFLMSQGARGVIGTECLTPAPFAEAWATRFFQRFLGGEALGVAFLALRRQFLREKGNPLGLLYAVHCDCDTLVTPALADLSDGLLEAGASDPR